MKFNFKGLFFVFLGFYFLIDPLRQLLLFGKKIEIFNDLGLQSLLLIFSSVSTFFMISFIVYYAFYKHLEKKQWVFLVGITLLGFLIPITYRFIVEQKIFDILFGFTNYRRDLSIIYFYRDNTYYYLMYGLLGAIFFYISYSKFKKRRESELVAENQQMQLSLLRAQINPHFLMNAMNNIYSLVYLKSDKSLLAIDKLSEILKYTLYENKETVKLSEEITYLENFIELQKMRYEKEPIINMNIDPEVLNGKVPQFLLVPLIENAFKHGDVHHAEFPIQISILKNGDNIDIDMFNRKKVMEKDEHGGIGLQNVQKRLDLIFGENHVFIIDETDIDFSIGIQIPLSL